MKTTRETKEDGSFTEVSTMQQNSIEMSMNAKRDLSFKVKVYEDDPVEAEKKLLKFMMIGADRIQEWEKANKKE